MAPFSQDLEPPQIPGRFTSHHERELVEDQRQHRQQERLADALHTGLDLPLTNRIDARDVIDALDPIEITLMHGIDPHKAGPAIGRRGLAYPDGVPDRSGFGEADALFLVARTPAFDVLIVGGGPAGLAAAIRLK